MFCRRAGQLHVSDTNVTRLSAPLVLQAEVMCLRVNYFATDLSDRAEPLDRNSREHGSFIPSEILLPPRPFRLHQRLYF